MFTTNLTQHLIRSSKLNLCPICQKDHGCRVGDFLIICLRADSSWTINGWTYKKQAKGGMGSVWVSHTEETQTEYRPTPNPTFNKPTLKPLTDQEIDINARLILKQLGLSTQHRQALRERGLTDAQIDSIGFVSVSPYQSFFISPSPNFPGIGYKKTLTNSDSGYLIPIRNIKGLIIGFQIANDHRGKENKNGKEIPKYQWLWGSGERRTSRELPLQFSKLNDSQDLNIIEGTLKPITAAHLHNINVLGSGGVNWHGSPQELPEILESNLFSRFILNPDTGCKANHHVMSAYRELYQFLKKLGINLLVRNWGQDNRPKTDSLDIDEIDTTTFNNASIIPFKSWDVEPGCLSDDEWFKKFKLPQLKDDLAQVLKLFYSRRVKKSKLRTEIKKQPTTPREQTPEQVKKSSAIVLWKPEFLTFISYIPGQLPTFEEWQELGSPKLIIQNGQRLTFYQEAYERGFKFLKDSTPAGHGKSYDAGLIDLKTFGIDPNDKDNHTRIFYLDPNHRNPTIATVETHYTDLESRHNGLVYDSTRKTPLGNPYVIRTNSSHKTVEIPSNCPENQTFLTIAKIGIPVFGGKDSPICQSCPLLLNGCTFLENRRNTLAHERLIRADINSLPYPSEDDILILEESDTNVKISHQMIIKTDDILKTVGKLQLGDDEQIFKALRPILGAVYEGLQEITQDKYKYGISHQHVMEFLPSVDQLNQVIWELYSEDWLKAKDVWGQPIWDYKMLNGEPKAVKVIGENWIAPSLNDLKKECYRIFDNYAKYINGIQSPEEKQAAIKANVIPLWLPALIDCLTGNKRINLRIHNGKLIITQLSKHHRNIIKTAGFSIALDATQSKEDYALSINVNPNWILEVREVQRPTPNLNIHVITGLGKGGKQRRETQQERIKIAIEAIIDLHQGQNMGLIDHKSAMDNYKDLGKHVQLGYWGRDNRGSNRFLTTQTLISVGKLVPNLGQMAAEFQTLTGWVNIPNKLIGHYGRWVKRKITSELIQDVGRLRAHLRPSENLDAYLVVDLESDLINEIQLAFPRSKVTIEDVYNYAPKAAPKGQQTEREIIEALWSSIQSEAPLTIEEVAEQLGMTKGGVSKNLKDRLGIGFRMLKKSLLLLLQAIYNKNKLSDLPEDARWIAETYLPLVAQSLDQEEITPLDVIVDIVNMAEAFGEKVFNHILAATSLPILLKLFGKVLSVLPKILSSPGGGNPVFADGGCARPPTFQVRGIGL
ncbi:hypothetical protein PL8927_120002 [Planktothrix serta PCC 8927]|uniref:Uncharacterized protein n=1 Tax=Planktothrix serta PCC 8927 TaxID=671068 RepID=A0A7Z9BF05_9CYAN|nr:sigma-70 family RNA polymerase sigma factor [Planktothrix serta]VXD10824.1 hypothetical protein PL8927_120002 [Planktothrix serta PCC 8927]